MKMRSPQNIIEVLQLAVQIVALSCIIARFKYKEIPLNQLLEKIKKFDLNKEYKQAF